MGRVRTDRFQAWAAPMTTMIRRLAILESHPSTRFRHSRPEHDLSRLTADQCLRLEELNVRFVKVGLEGLTDDELDEIIELVGIIEVRSES